MVQWESKYFHFLSMIFLILFAFLSGIMTIFAPCIWPLLPIVLSAGASGGERRPFGIIVGLMVSFTFFTLTLSYILKIIPIDVVTLRLFAIITIALLGLALVVPRFGTFLEAGTSRLFGTRGNFLQKREGFKGGFITGVALGLVWSPCAGTDPCHGSDAGCYPDTEFFCDFGDGCFRRRCCFAAVHPRFVGTALFYQGENAFPVYRPCSADFWSGHHSFGSGALCRVGRYASGKVLGFLFGKRYHGFRSFSGQSYRDR